MSITDTYRRSAQEAAQLVTAQAWESPDFYAAWLSQTFHYVRHTTRLLARAASRCSFEQEAIHERLLENAAEESGHHLLLLSDLAAIERSLADHPVSEPTQSFIDVLYDRIDQQGPVAVYGRLLLLEGLAVEVGDDLHRRVMRSHGSSAASFLRVHTDEDPGHVEKALRSIDALPPPAQALIAETLEESVSIYAQMLSRMREPT